MFGWLKNLTSPSHNRPVNRRSYVRVVRARFDAAVTTDENRRHWASADSLSPNAALNPEVRRTLRNRSRYEVANNSYARGIVLTLANDVIGTGPRLQMLADSAEAIQLTEHCHTVDRIAAELERGHLASTGWADVGSPLGAALDAVLAQWARAGLLSPRSGGYDLTLAGQFWSVQMGSRLARLVQSMREEPNVAVR